MKICLSKWMLWSALSALALFAQSCKDDGSSGDSGEPAATPAADDGANEDSDGETDGADGTGGSGETDGDGTTPPGADPTWTWSMLSSPAGFEGRSSALFESDENGNILVWGGDGATGSLADGAVYDIANDSWTMMSSSGAPSHRTDLFNFRDAVDPVGGKLYVFGSRSVTGGSYYSGSTTLANRSDGAVYDIAGDSWSALPAIPQQAPYAGRAYLSGTWTGDDLLLFGGNKSASDGTNDYDFLATDDAQASKFDPSDDSWSTIDMTDGPSNRKHATVVFTGDKLFVWSGQHDGNYFTDGYIYDVAADSWSSISTTNAPTGRRAAFYALAGDKVVIWGGLGNGETPLADGAVYDITNDTWTTMDTGHGLTERASTARGVWTGTHFVVFGGITVDSMFNFSYFNDGAVYDPAANSWESLPAPPSEVVAAGKKHAEVFGGAVYYFGGWTGDDDFTNQMFRLKLE